jgi:hypothetical protein
VKRSWAFNGLISGAALLLPLTAATESQLRSGTQSASLSATAQLNFKIIIPKVLSLEVAQEGIINSPHTLCALDGKPALAGSRLICTASMP